MQNRIMVSAVDKVFLPKINKTARCASNMYEYTWLRTACQFLSAELPAKLAYFPVLQDKYYQNGKKGENQCSV